MYSASGGGPGSMDSFSSMTADILMDFDFISASTDFEMTDMSGTSEGEFGYMKLFFRVVSLCLLQASRKQILANYLDFKHVMEVAIVRFKGV